MSMTDFTAISFLLLTAGWAVVLMLAIALRRHHTAAAILTVAGLGTAFAALLLSAQVGPRYLSPLLTVDGYARFYAGLILITGLAVTLLSYGYWERHRGNREEYYLLLLLATLGALVLVCSSHFVSFFLGLETLTVSLYALIAYPYLRQRPVEAGIKYLLLAAASSAFLLFGMALIYAETGTMEFARLATRIRDIGGGGAALMLPGTVMVIVGIGFKLAVIPFHMWVPDVYEGAPAPATAFLATVSKGGIFALLVRYFHPADIINARPLFLIFALIAVASMLGGNLLALYQSNVKRILAYSSIAHMGYLLVAFLAGASIGPQAATFYLVAYFITTLGAFGVVAVLSEPASEAGELHHYRALFQHRPALAGVFTVMLLSLAGIPLTAGFVGKFFVVAAGASSSLWGLIAVLVLASTIGVFYYLRIVVAMYGSGDHPPIGAERAVPAAGAVALAGLTGCLFWLGVYPAPVWDAVVRAVASLA